MQINPPYHIRLIEIVPAPWTSQEVVGKTKNFMKEIGQAPVTFKKEIPGFGVNRIQWEINFILSVKRAISKKSGFLFFI